MKKKRLKLDRETIRILDTSDLTRVVGGWLHPPMTISCPQPGTTH